MHYSFYVVSADRAVSSEADTAVDLSTELLMSASFCTVVTTVCYVHSNGLF